MQLGVISDIHANQPALEAVLSDMPDVDRIVCGGDVVGYYPWPSECLERIRNRGIPCVEGNHDRAVGSGDASGLNEMARAGVRYARDTLSADQLEWLRALPREHHAVDGRVKIVHDHPTVPGRYTYPRDFSSQLLGDEDVLILGHTHVQHTATYADGIVLNPGSVGQPRDGNARAAYAVVDLDGREVDERRVDYDIDPVEKAVDEAGLPGRVASRLREGG